MPTYTTDLTTTGNVTCATLTQTTRGKTITKDEHAERALVKHDLPLQDFFTHNAPQTKLPGTAAADDLGLIGATFLTNALQLETLDEKGNAGAHSVYGRTTFRIPDEYVAAATIQIVIAAGAKTTISDTSMTVDAEVGKVHATDGTVGADLASPAAQDCNNLTGALKTFTINGAGLSAGDMLDIRIAIITNDAATGTAVIGLISAVYMQLDSKG